MPLQCGPRRRRPSHLAVGVATLAFALSVGLTAGASSLLLRLPGLHELGPGWQKLAHAHATLLTFFSAIPALAGGFSTLLVPSQIGASDTASPGAALAALLLTVGGFAAAVLGASGLLGGGAVWPIAAAALTASGAVLGAANMVATVLNERARVADRLTLFVWAELIGAVLIICAAPMMAASFSLSVWRGAAVSQALPPLIPLASCILVIPALGLLSDILTSLTRLRLVGQRVGLLALASLGGVAFTGWAAALLHGAAPPVRVSVDQAIGVAIAATTAVLLVCWTITLARSGRWRALASAPGVHLVGFVAAMAAGAMAYMSNDRFHDAVTLAIVFAMFAGFYWWLPAVTGQRLPLTLGRIQSWLLVAGVAMMLLPVTELRVVGAAMVSLSVALFGGLVAMMLLGRRRLERPAWAAASGQWVPAERGGRS